MNEKSTSFHIYHRVNVFLLHVVVYSGGMSDSKSSSDYDPSQSIMTNHDHHHHSSRLPPWKFNDEFASKTSTSDHFSRFVNRKNEQHYDSSRPIMTDSKESMESKDELQKILDYNNKLWEVTNKKCQDLVQRLKYELAELHPLNFSPFLKTHTTEPVIKKHKGDSIVLPDWIMPDLH